MPLGFELTDLLALDDSLMAATATMAVSAGEDAAPEAMLLGAPEITGTVVQQWVQGGLAGCRYRLTFVAEIGKRLVESGELTVRAR